MASHLLEWYRRITQGTSLYIVACDISHLGSYSVLGLLIIFTITYLYLQKEYQKAMIVVAFAFATGTLSEAMGLITGATTHPILTMSVYLIVAISLNIGQRRFLITYSAIVTILIGISQVIIGTSDIIDIIIGWIISGIVAYTFSLANNWVERTYLLKRRSNDEMSALAKLDDTSASFHKRYISTQPDHR